MFWNKPKAAPQTRCEWNPETERPVFRASICTGEKSGCIQDRKSGHLREICVLHTPQQAEDFAAACGVALNTIPTVY